MLNAVGESAIQKLLNNAAEIKNIVESMALA
jgi:hypothetical protein